MSTFETTTWSKYTTKEEWLNQNEEYIMEFWKAMKNFLESSDTGTGLLANCDYNTLRTFIVDNSVLYDNRD